MYQPRRPALRQVCALTGAPWRLSHRGGADAEGSGNDERKPAKRRSGPVLELRQAGSLRRRLADDVLRV